MATPSDSPRLRGRGSRPPRRPSLRQAADVRDHGLVEIDPELRPGVGTITQESLAEEEELWTDRSGDDHGGWFCVSTDAFPCPAAGCEFVARFMTAAHLILVWEQQDDPNLLRHAQRAKAVGRNPRIVSYETGFGPSASYYAWEAAGRPVHGVRQS